MGSLQHLSNAAVTMPRDELDRIIADVVTAHQGIARAVAILLDRVDTADGDPDDEPGGDDEPREADGDMQDASVPEWAGLHPAWRRGPMPNPGHEDSEAAGDEQDGTFAEDEECAKFARMARGPGCEISDPDSAVDDQRCDPDEGH